MMNSCFGHCWVRVRNGNANMSSLLMRTMRRAYSRALLRDCDCAEHLNTLMMRLCWACWTLAWGTDADGLILASLQNYAGRVVTEHVLARESAMPETWCGMPVCTAIRNAAKTILDLCWTRGRPLLDSCWTRAGLMLD